MGSLIYSCWRCPTTLTPAVWPYPLVLLLGIRFPALISQENIYSIAELGKGQEATGERAQGKPQDVQKLDQAEKAHHEALGTQAHLLHLPVVRWGWEGGLL